MFVLGIDPGLSRCGYCVIEARGQQQRLRSIGIMTTPANVAVPHRLAELLGDVRSIMDEYPITAVAVERVLFQVNVSTAMGVGQASGVIMAEAATRGCSVTEYSPNQVKDAVAGSGSADKVQVQQMVKQLLGLPTVPEPADAADAAAVALTHLAFTSQSVPAASRRVGVVS